MQFGEFGKDGQIKTSPMWIIACVPMALRIQIAKLKFYQYVLRTNSPNLVFTKISLYLVCTAGVQTRLACPRLENHRCLHSVYHNIY